MAKKFQNQHWSYYHIRKLENLSKVGDLKATQELRAYHNALVRQANLRLQKLNKAGISRYAYEKEQSFLLRLYGTNKQDKQITRFKTASTLNFDTEVMRRQILAIQSFLDMETSTVEGVQAVENRRIEIFRNYLSRMDGGVGKYSDMINDDTKIEGFLKFLGEDYNRQLLKNAGKMESGTLVDYLFGKYETTPLEEIGEEVSKYIETLNSSSLGITRNNADAYHYDKLQKYLGMEVT